MSACLLFSCSDVRKISQDSKPNSSITQTTPAPVKTRLSVYPRIDSKIDLNPPSLIVPQDLRKDAEKIVFYLSKDPNFESDDTIKTKPTKGNIFTPEQKLDTGLWYWRYVYLGADGSVFESPLSSFMIYD